MVFLTCFIAFLLAAAFLVRRKAPQNRISATVDDSFAAFFVIRFNVIVLWLLLTAIKLLRRLKRRKHPELETKQVSLPSDGLKRDEEFEMGFCGSDPNGNMANIRVQCNKNESYAFLNLHFANGRSVSIEQRSGEFSVSDHSMSVVGLRIQKIHPVKNYRILYDGLMKVDGTDDQYVEVHLRLWYRATCDPTHRNVDFSPIMLARTLATEPHPFRMIAQVLRKRSVNVVQSGELRGRWQIVGDQPIDVSLLGNRLIQRNRFTSATPKGLLCLNARTDSGLVFNLKAESHGHPRISHHVSGFVAYQTSFVYPVTWSDLHLSQIQSGDFSSLRINLEAHGTIFEIVATKMSEVSAIDINGLVTKEISLKINVNNEQSGYGILSFNDNGASVKPVIPMRNVLVEDIACPSLSGNAPFVVPLEDPLCRVSALTGGKAARLADITAALKADKRNKPDFVIPDGFTVTTAAYEQHLLDNPELAKLIDHVLDLAKKQKLTDLEPLCEQVHEAFATSNVSDRLHHALIDQLKRSFGPTDWEKTYTAVRSSAVGEDGVEASGAGQMETFLGRRGLEKITEAIKLCWASHFAFRAIEYRRQLCAKLDTPMAVVVQRLVRADVAGVLFTRHPDTGSTARSLINACYGIGEGVVSGHVQPDTISVYKTSPDDDDVRIVYDSLGEKASAYKLDEEKGEVTEQADSHVHGQCCLTELEIRRLYQIGLQIEGFFGAPTGRDIEFALLKGNETSPSQILILQARPITTADMEEEWELIHEFDSPLPSEQQWVTTANVQEMCPGALTPLSADVWVNWFGGTMENLHSDVFLKPRRRFMNRRTAVCAYQHVFMNYTTIGTGIINDFVKMSVDTALFGKPLQHIVLNHYMEQNDLSSPFWKFIQQLQANACIFREKRKMRTKFAAKIDSQSLRPSNDPQEIYRQLMTEILPFTENVWDEHIKVSYDSSVFPVVLMCIMDSSMKWGPQIYDDTATMLSSCDDIISAQVPVDLQAIGESIKTDQAAKEHFLAVDRLNAADWFESSDSGKHGQLYRTFMQKHGHRCIRDSDVREKSWSQEPEKLIDAIKIIVAQPSTDSTANKKDLKSVAAVEDAIAALKTPLNAVQKFLLKIFIPKTRAIVRLREYTKNYSLKASEHARRAIHQLADVMHQQGYIPDSDLLFFFSLDEIGQVLGNENSSKLIAKALRRRKLMRKFVGLKFPELSQHHPHPIKEELVAHKSSKAIKGVAVGQGSIEGTARVIRSLADANQIQQGDILIVSYTDVGWTPYFPLISGLVTELGGLISHGAVVAREYGLPCLVGCKNATQIVRNGDRVRIDGPSGEVHIL